MCRADRVCVPMDKLPGVVFAAKGTRDPQVKLGCFLSTRHLGTPPLQFMDGHQVGGPGSVMAPTADALYDFYGPAVTGLPLF